MSIRRKLHGRADVNIGKRGVSEEVLREIKRRMEKEGVVKVRLLRGFLKATSIDRRSAASLIAERIGAKLIDVRGCTFILVGRRKVFKQRSSFKTKLI
ncbi:MAG: YhbY family RNA-binding protein [Sulfolobales archaeon]|nr:YhbY family RNA-binding protein [Sulfolobales archaeon]MCX8199489.1 YhbY family RNA-binding protein [Sulfolobales archaeon]MDW8170835.1 YhbY family RNA-binding protein [Desulfurococcaceae archaeon]